MITALDLIKPVLEVLTEIESIAKSKSDPVYRHNTIYAVFLANKDLFDKLQIDAQLMFEPNTLNGKREESKTNFKKTIDAIEHMKEQLRKIVDSLSPK